MGQKVHPTGFRLGVIKKHNALWYAKGKSYRENLIEDLKVRNHISEKLRFSSISKVELERSAQNFVVNIHTSRPGIIIGKKGEEIESLNQQIQANAEFLANEPDRIQPDIYRRLSEYRMSRKTTPRPFDAEREARLKAESEFRRNTYSIPEDDNAS